MPFALIVFGVVLLVTGVRGTTSDLWRLLKGDFSGPGNFVFWVISIIVIGSIGYIEKLRPLSNAFLALVLISLFLSNKGFFNQFSAQLQATTMPTIQSGLDIFGEIGRLNDSLKPISTPPFTIPDFSSLFHF